MGPPAERGANMNISVVIPAKNEEGVIDSCLDSLAAQVRDGDEILVLDNGSTDGTAAVARSFEAVTVIDAPDDAVEATLHYRGNLDAIRQFGAERASNEIIATTDADTIPPDGWLDRIRTHFENDPELDLVWGVPVDTNGVPVRNMESKFANVFGAVSGCNTAFKKSTFESLKKGYVGWPMYEDMAIVNRISRVGKTIRDTDLVMPTEMDRTRFQTIPMMVASGVGITTGALIGGPVGAALVGGSAGLGLTELFYEQAPSTRFHHDQVGLLSVIGGTLVGGPVGAGAVGLGSGMVAHHVLTEGVSAIPTDLFEQTDMVCRVPEEAEGDDVLIVCETANSETQSLTRVLAAVAFGSLVGAGIGAVRAK